MSHHAVERLQVSHTNNSKNKPRNPVNIRKDMIAIIGYFFEHHHIQLWNAGIDQESLKTIVHGLSDKQVTDISQMAELSVNWLGDEDVSGKQYNYGYIRQILVALIGISGFSDIEQSALVRKIESERYMTRLNRTKVSEALSREWESAS